MGDRGSSSREIGEVGKGDSQGDRAEDGNLTPGRGCSAINKGFSVQALVSKARTVRVS